MACEAGVSAVVGAGAGACWYILSTLGFGSGSPVLFLASFLGLPILFFVSWTVFSGWRRENWRMRRLWAGIRLAVGLVVLLPAFYGGFRIGKALYFLLFGYPPD